MAGFSAMGGRIFRYGWPDFPLWVAGKKRYRWPRFTAACNIIWM